MEMKPYSKMVMTMTTLKEMLNTKMSWLFSLVVEKRNLSKHKKLSSLTRKGPLL